MQHLLDPHHEYWNNLIRKKGKLLDALSKVTKEIALRPCLPPKKETITPEEVQRFRKEYESGMQTVTGLAKQAGLHKSTMSRLLRFKIHKS